MITLRLHPVAYRDEDYLVCFTTLDSYMVPSEEVMVAIRALPMATVTETEVWIGEERNLDVSDLHIVTAAQLVGITIGDPPPLLGAAWAYLAALAPTALVVIEGIQ